MEKRLELRKYFKVLFYFDIIVYMIKDFMKQFLKKYCLVLLGLFIVSISFVSSYATFRINHITSNVTQMFVNEIEYDMHISCSGESRCSINSNIVVIRVADFSDKILFSFTSSQEVDTYYKVVFYRPDGYTDIYYDSGYDLPYGVIKPGETKTVSVRFNNELYRDFEVFLNVYGGFVTDSLDNIEYDNEYLVIENPSPWYYNCYSDSTDLKCKMLADNRSFADNVNSTYVKNTTPGIDFSTISSDTNGKGLYYTYDLTRNDDYDGDGTGERVYYYRGDVHNNYLTFAGYCWRIVRTNEDESIRLRYSGIYDSTAGCTEPGTTSLAVTSDAFNHTVGDNSYVGYMMGIDNECFTGECDGVTRTTSYLEAHTNTYNSNIKKLVDSWYENNILTQGNTVTSKIENSIYCNDRSISDNTLYGYGTIQGYYSAYYRLFHDAKPQYKCLQQNDSFTLKKDAGGIEGYGNNALKYPVALLTADELTFAGFESGSRDSNNFLNDVSLYWSLTPARFDSTDAVNFYVYNGYTSHAGTFIVGGVFPAISLKKNVLISNGTGVYNDPYVVE